MKKKFTISAVLVLITIIGFAQCPTYFRRNNGNGTCGNQAEIRMYFAACPVIAPTMDSIYANGVKLNLTIGAPDTASCSKGYISYCFSGDLPPVSSLQVFFNFDTVGSTGSACNVPEGPSAGPAPVVLSSFSSRRSGQTTVDVTWKTEQEFNSSRFEILRSTAHTAFVPVGIVDSKSPNSNIAQLYSFTDHSNNLQEVSYYRLKMIDIDNSFTLSDVRSVKGNGMKTDVTVYPNPVSVNEQVTISNLSEPSDVSVYDNTGRLIQQTSTGSGNSVGINRMQKGSYFIKITGKVSGSSSVKKLAVIN